MRSRTSPDRRDDGGFLLLESVVAVTVVTVVMTALAALLMTANRSTTRQRDAQTASRLAVSALDRARAIGAAGAVSGRDGASTQTQFATAPATAPAVAPWLAGMTPAVDPTAASGSGATAAVPTVAVPRTRGGNTFEVSYFVGYCWRPAAGDDGDCTPAADDGAIQYVRVVVAVVWSGAGCEDGGCSYVSATLLNGSGDPVFNVNQSGPPQLDVVRVPDQVSTVDRPVHGVDGIDGCASPCAISASGGAPPVIFSKSGLPPGLRLDPNSGLVTGTPTEPGRFTVTITATDSFLNADTETFAWRVRDDG